MASYTKCPLWYAQARGRQRGLVEGFEKGCQQALQVHKKVSKNNQKTSLFINLNIIVEKVKEIVNAEDYVRNRFEEQGYETQDCRMVGGGHPDFIFRKGMDVIYVEVKSDVDGLKINQAQWILQNKDKKVIVYYVDGGN